MRMTDLRPGWAVVDNVGRRFGTVKEVGQNYVLTSRGGLAGELYVPASAIANIGSEVVHLNLAHDEAEQMGWQQPPRGDDTLETTPESDLHRHV
jgi:hypothetical protein